MLAKIVIGLLHCYRWVISPLFPPSCRYVPTCSRYAIQAIEIHGLWRGLWLTSKRVSRCHPFTSLKIAFTVDPVPLAEKVPANKRKNAHQQHG